MEGLTDRARREKPNCGARKIRERLLRRLPSEVKVPARSTIHAILDRHGLVTRSKRSRTRTEGTPLSEGASPNALWCADYKGEFMLGDRRYCYPLTVTDHASRYLLLCEAMQSNAEKTAFTAFERLFKERGLPDAIRSDNGVPIRFAQRVVQSLQTLGLVVALGHQHRTNPTRASATERSA